MKTNVVLAVTFILFFVASAYAQEPLSLRNRALSGSIDDDLDLVYDPIELRYIDSLRLYSNLTDFALEQLFVTPAINEFFIGASRKNPFIDDHWLALLFKFTKAKESLPVYIQPDLTGFNSLMGEGTLETEYTQYVDLGTNGLYDLKRTIRQQETSFNDYDTYAVLLNNTYYWNDITYGLKLSYSSNNYENSRASLPLGTSNSYLSSTYYNDPTFNRHFEDFYLDSNYSPLIWSEEGTFKTIRDNPVFKANASAMKELDEYELRGDFKFYTIDNSSTSNDMYTGTIENFNPNVASYKKIYTERFDYTNVWERDGLAFGGGVSLRYTFNPQAERKNNGYVSTGVGFVYETFDFSDDSIITSRTYNYQFDGYYSGTTDVEVEVNQRNHNTDDGTGSAFIWQWVTRANFPFSNDVLVGIGSYVTIWSEEIETKFFSDYRSSTDNIIDDNLSNSSDYITRQTYSLKADRTRKNHNLILTIPVGVEMKFGEEKRWAFRVGTSFTYLKETYDDTKQVTNSTPNTTTTYRGDGSSSVSISSNQYASQSVHRVEASSSKAFTFGFGWNPSDHIQTDLLGYLSLTKNVNLQDYLKNIRLSFVIKL